MGLKSWLHWLAWFIESYSIQLVSGVLIVVASKVSHVLRIRIVMAMENSEILCVLDPFSRWHLFSAAFRQGRVVSMFYRRLFCRSCLRVPRLNTV